MDRRLKVHEMLVAALGSNHVYFQPDQNVRMQYPAIVYSIESFRVNHANNDNYIGRRTYSVQVIDRNPDSIVSEAVSKLPKSRFSRWFAADGLNHFEYKITI